MDLAQALAIVLFTLIAKAQLLAAATSATRGKLGIFVNEEDARWLKGATVEVDDPRVRRLRRAHLNDLEALLPFAIVSGLYLASSAPAVPGLAYFGIFLIARLLHTVAYLGRRPALRRATFTAGWAINFVIGAHALWGLFANG